MLPYLARRVGGDCSQTQSPGTPPSKLDDKEDDDWSASFFPSSTSRAKAGGRCPSPVALPLTTTRSRGCTDTVIARGGLSAVPAGASTTLSHPAGPGSTPLPQKHPRNAPPAEK